MDNNTTLNLANQKTQNTQSNNTPETAGSIAKAESTGTGSSLFTPAPAETAGSIASSSTSSSSASSSSGSFSAMA